MLETILGAVIGAVTGAGTGKASPALDAGTAVNGVAGLLGGLGGAALLGGDAGWLTDLLGNSEMAGALVGGGVGGAVLSAIVGFIKNKMG